MVKTFQGKRSPGGLSPRAEVVRRALVALIKRVPRDCEEVALWRSPAQNLRGYTTEQPNISRREPASRRETMNHPLQCQCGAVKGFVSHPQAARRTVCYCKDCQAFAHFLGRAGEVLDERGGSDVIQTLPKNVTFTQGIEALACMRLSPKGLLRWYASCCNTPIGNTLSSPNMSFIGLVHTCLENGGKSLSDSFGPVRAYVGTESAKGDPKPKKIGLPSVLLWFVGTTLKARLNGDYKRSPFFVADTGAPIVTPRVLSMAERTSLVNAVLAAG